MIFNIDASYQYLITELDKRNIKYVVHEFDSGAKMIDIWFNDLFYVVQIEKDFVGISLIDDDNTSFDTTPDIKFFTINEFETKLSDIFG